MAGQGKEEIPTEVVNRQPWPLGHGCAFNRQPSTIVIVRAKKSQARDHYIVVGNSLE
ncbi:MAG: hypothetical protein F6K50_47160 [Moorea sp. SIO3I7]|uniref:hypothetical protein n=1 Tax=Moorena sp. SIO3I6 TaxID=2607831 RepID=UPI0013C6EBA2|nr:hypothetical protein [Moorena sp. SIO3I6]NEO02657.1 hypothetical protein [Moorena sp. SIO3I7]NEP27631.1 hypothetical protein [Moorena sp. SIO3I6]